MVSRTPTCRFGPTGYIVSGVLTRSPSRRSPVGSSPQDAAQQIGYRIPIQEGLDMALNSGLRAAAVYRDAIATAPGASLMGEVEYVRPDGAPMTAPPALKNVASLCKLFRWQFGDCSFSSGPAEGLLSGEAR